KADGSYGGYAAWGGHAKAVKKGDVVPLTYSMPALKDGMKGVSVIYYLSPGGFEQRDQKFPTATSPSVAFPGAPAAKAASAKAPSGKARPATAAFKKSWMKLGAPHKTDGGNDPWVEGDEITLPIEYYVAPEDDWGGTSIQITIVGPWNDDAQGKYLNKRTHVNYPGMGGGWIAAKDVKIGAPAKTEFRFTLAAPYTALPPEKGKFGDCGILIAQFHGADGSGWPWQRRSSFGAWQRKQAFFELDADAPGNLFTYDQPVVMHAIIDRLGANGGDKALRYTVTDAKGQEAAKGEIPFKAGAKGQKIPIPLKLKTRGTFVLRGEVDGWEAREVTFATIPNLEKILGDKPTPFGGQKFEHNLEAIKCARMLGMSTARLWTSWAAFEPEKGKINEASLASWEKCIDDLNAHHIRPFILFDAPPGWAIKNPKVHGVQFKPFPFDAGEVTDIVTVLAKRFKDKISGFEWLNEIVAGDVCEDPVAEYVRFCKVATAAAKKVNPKFRMQSAGGLWPQTFRKALLAQGLSRHVDILSIHYANDVGTREARANCAAVGEPGKAIWDNETAACDSTWQMPLSEAIQRTKQSNWFFNNFPGELLAGSQQIIVFGGDADACGNWTHFWSDMSPRPSAAALAVLASKLSLAKPVGEFFIGKTAFFRLFNDNGKAVMLVASLDKKGETVDLPTGQGAMVATDQQGNESPLTTKDGVTKFAANDQAYFAEGGDLEVIEAQLVARISSANSGMPQLTFIKGAETKIPLTLTNFYARPLTCSLTLSKDGAPGAAEPLKVTLKPGETRPASLVFAAAQTGSFPTAVEVTFDYQKLPKVRKAVQLNVIDPASVGNLVKNPGFEQGQGGNATGWGGTGKDNAKRVEHQDPGELGHNGWVFNFHQCKNYTSIWQNCENLTPGDYVYTAWIKARDLETGSNATVIDVNGKKKDMNWLGVFVAPRNQEHWEIFTKVVKQPKEANIAKLGIVPVARGGGDSWMDNLQVSLYEGTEFNAFAPKAPGAIKIDGDLSDFNRLHPVPLLGRAQLRGAPAGGKWTPKDLSGVAYFNWTPTALYVSFEVLDDQHVASKNGENANEDDSVEIGFHPLNRVPGEDAKAFRFIVSAANPGGGSGKDSLFRPAKQSGGLSEGSLAKDSSTYEIVVKRNGAKTIYEVAMPWAELGGVTGGFGTKVGLSLILNDNDGSGRKQWMCWGEGLRPWAPASFGMMVLTND
ncbi:MAG: hypothetical protein J6333_00190, partial [Planctomycetes bacterium]|nr:hypothetical protein [Planctomycetota bacterium]